MSRYIYDELKEEFKDYDLKPSTIVECMADAVHGMGYKVPGDVPENEIEIFKQRAENLIRLRIKLAAKITIYAMRVLTQNNKEPK